MPTNKVKSKKVVQQKTDGYESDVEQSKHLKTLKAEFQTRLETAAKLRVSRSDMALRFRRLDSLARLLEGNSICAAVYFDVTANELWLANNKVHTGSHAENEQIKTLKSVFNLVSNEHLSIEEIFTQLGDIIYLNVSQEKRFDLAKLNATGFNLKATIKDWLKNMFKSNHQTKQWREDTQENFEYESDDTKNIIKNLIKRTARLARDLLKLRDFLLDSNKQDAISIGILAAIRDKKFRILHTENKDVHAEMRVIAEVLNKNKQQSYIGISKLCCDHCSLAMDAFGLQNRGKHGQRANWPIPGFITNNLIYLKKYIGSEAYQVYQKMNKATQRVALEFVASKESNSIKENAKHGRSMEADSSESDIEFGVSHSDEEKATEINSFSLNKVWQLRHVMYCYKNEFERLEELGLALEEIIDLYRASTEKLTALGGVQACYLIARIAQNLEGTSSAREIFEQFSDLYDENEKLFWLIVEDEAELVAEYSLEEICQRFEARDNSGSDDEISSNDKDVIYAEVVDELLEENGWDYDYNSDDSANCWGYKDDSTSEEDFYNSYSSSGESSESNNSSSDEELNERVNCLALRKR